MVTYKVVEISQVDDLSLEKNLNEWTEKGWHFDRLQFAMSDGSRRPTMAFLFFIQEEEDR